MIETLFTQALGLVAPWQVDHVNFVQEAGRIDFRVKFGAAIHACPACGEGAQPLHGRLARTWRHLDFFEYEAHLHAEVPRVAWVSERFAVQGLLPSNPLTKALTYAMPATDKAGWRCFSPTRTCRSTPTTSNVPCVRFRWGVAIGCPAGPSWG